MRRTVPPEQLDQALALLGLDRGTDPTAVRAAYRDVIRRHHPDVTESDGTYAQRLTEAHACVVASFDETGSLPPPPSSASSVRSFEVDDTAPRDALAADDPLNDEDSLTIIAPAEDVFLAMYEALQAVGDVTYVDRDGGLLEALVSLTDQPPSQLLVTFQGRAHGTEAMFTLTANGNETPPAIGSVVERVAHALQNAGT